jgi:hypothetical protein
MAGLEIREYNRRDPPCWPRGTPYQQKLALTSPTRGGSSSGIVRSRTQATEFSFSFNVIMIVDIVKKILLCQKVANILSIRSDLFGISNCNRAPDNRSILQLRSDNSKTEH